MPETAPVSLLITSAYSDSPQNFIASEARRWIEANPAKRWRLVDDPKIADLILFLEHHPGNDPLFFRVLFHPWRRKWPKKCWLYHDCDFVFPLMRGIYPGLEYRFSRPNSVESWFYVAQICENKVVEYVAPSGQETYLYSFTGARRTHLVRSKIFDLTDSRAWLQDTSNQNNWELTDEELASYHRQYARLIQNSKFILCPRGISPTSYRLLEAMKAGRVPVIISDDWVFPINPHWSEFAIIVPESEVTQIPQLLRKHESEAAARGQAARKAWEAWCADDQKYSRLFERFETLTKIQKKIGALPLRTVVELLKSGTGLRLLWHSVKGYREYMRHAS